MTDLLHAALDEMFEWIIMHKASVLDGMTRREQRDFTDALGKARAALAADRAGAFVPPSHPDDLAIDRFALAMKAKMARSRAKGRGGWDDPAQCRVEDLAEMLREHIGKGNAGNFEDIANLAMMLHARGADPAILACAPDPAPASVGQRLLRAADEALAIARGEAEPARVHVPCASKVDHEGESDAMIKHGLTMEEDEDLADLIRSELGGALCNEFAAASLADALRARFEMRPRAQAEKESE